MMIPVESQLMYFAATIVLGVLMGFLFEIYRVARIELRLRKAVTNVFDVLIWLLFTVLVFLFLWYLNYGEVRLYVFVGLAAGMAIHFRFLGKPSRAVVGLFFKIARKVIFVTARIIMVPVSIVQKVLLFPANLLSLVLLKVGIPVSSMLTRLKGFFKRNHRKK